MSQPLHPDLLSRLVRLEEAIGFADRAAEEAGVQAIDLYRRLDALTKRIEMVERRITEVATSPTAASPAGAPTDQELRDNRPPHSA